MILHIHIYHLCKFAQNVNHYNHYIIQHYILYMLKIHVTL